MRRFHLCLNISSRRSSWPCSSPGGLAHLVRIRPQLRKPPAHGQQLLPVNGKVLRRDAPDLTRLRMWRALCHGSRIYRASRRLQHPLSSCSWTNPGRDFPTSNPCTWATRMGLLPAISIPVLESARLRWEPRGARFALRSILGADRTDGALALPGCPGAPLASARSRPVLRPPGNGPGTAHDAKTDRASNQLLVYQPESARHHPARRFASRKVSGVFGVVITLDTVSAFLRELQVVRTGRISSRRGRQETGHHGPGKVTRTVMDRDGRPHVLPARGHRATGAGGLYARYASGEDIGWGASRCRWGQCYLPCSPPSRLALLPGIRGTGGAEADFTGPIAANQAKGCSSPCPLGGRHPCHPLRRQPHRPDLVKITAESRTIRDLDLDGPSPCAPHHRVSELAEAMQAMKAVCGPFGRSCPWVPGARSGPLGGRGPNGGPAPAVTLLFTDVADSPASPSLAGGGDADHELHFREAGSVIAHHGGTIDNHGDALMASGYAPELLVGPHPPGLRRHLAAPRTWGTWSSAHGGTASPCTPARPAPGRGGVGNVGSADRINYTAWARP